MLKFNPKKSSISTVLSFLLFIPALCFGQSATVSSHNESVQQCYQAATSVATVEHFEIDDYMIEGCNVALVELGLTNDDRAATFVNRGILHAASGSMAEALTDYEEALILSPDLGQIFLNRGIVYLFENQLDLAMADFNHALELDIPSSYLAYFARGVIYEEWNLRSKAIDDYKSSLEFNPDWRPAKTRLSQIMEQAEISGYELAVQLD